ncbi:MAG: hypothetical protein N2320_01845 [Candidatus Bipolaricaulota bacterium]|nr:hypothetical protein [Candidatus Bipolaricaulota bacterium]
MLKRAVVSTMVGVALVGLSVAGAVTLCDYRQPRTSLTSLWLTGTYRYFEDPATPGVDVNAGRIGLDHTRFLDSPNFGYTVTALGELGFVNFVPKTITAQAAHALRYYFASGEPYFGFGGIQLGYATGQPQLGATVSLGAGYGRFANVTPLAKALRIQKLLLARKVISQDLPDDYLLAMGNEIGKWAEYAAGKTREQAAKDLAAALVVLVQRATKATVDPRTVLAVEDVVLATGQERYCGWAVQGGLGYELLDPTGGSRDVVLTLSADAAFAPTPEAQLLLRAAAEGPFNIANEHTLSFTASYEQELGPTAALQGKVLFQRRKAPGEAPADSITASGQLSFTWGKAQIGIGVALAKGPTAPGWSLDLNLSLAMKVL